MSAPSLGDAVEPRIPLREWILERGSLGLLLYVLLLNLPYLGAHVVPVHDTFYNFINFQVFYSEFFLHGDLVQWYPYGAFGLPADFQQLISLTPLDYLVGAWGALLRVRDAMLLFKLSAIAEQMVFVLGIWLLARRLFATRATAFALGISAAGTVVWYAQQWFELRFFYGLPLLLYFFTSFLEQQRPAALWLAGLTAVAWSLGNAPYFIPLWVLVLAIVAAAPALGQRGAWSRLLQPRLSDLLLLGAFVLAAASYAQLALHSVDSLVMRDLGGRDPFSGAADLESFRSYGGNADLRVVARSLATGWPLQLPWGLGADNSLYLGLLPLLGLGIALARDRSRLFLSLVAAALALVWLSVGGVFATLVFHLPGMSQYRHVGLVYGLAKALLLVAAGFGLERLWRWRLPLPSRLVLAIAAGVAIVASLGVVPLLLRGFGTAAWASDWTGQLALRIWCCVALPVLSLAATRSVKAGLLLALALDLGIYQAAVYQLRVPKLGPEYTAMLGAFDAAPLTYQARRSRQPSATGSNRRQRQVHELARHPASMEVYWVTYQLADFDPCRSEYWNEFATYGVDRLTRLEAQRGLKLDAVVGCGVDKLRVTSDVTLVSDAGAAREAFLATHQGSAPARDVIRGAAGVDPPTGGPPLRSSGAVEVTHFSPNELVAKVVAEGGDAWLIYADALYPGWHATVDGQPTPIAEANLAFKAVRVPAGESVVRFWFQRGLSYYASYAVAIFGLLCGLAFVALVFVDPFASSSR